MALSPSVIRQDAVTARQSRIKGSHPYRFTHQDGNRGDGRSGRFAMRPVEGPGNHTYCRAARTRTPEEASAVEGAVGQGAGGPGERGFPGRRSRHREAVARQGGRAVLDQANGVPAPRAGRAP